MTWFFRKKSWPDVDLSEIKKRARMLVIDDADFPYQSLFERDGYTLEKWPDVTDLPKLESGFYDVILLDLQGVGREQSVEQGLGILRHLRHSSPAQVIIAYSSADWSLKYQEFFDLADAVLAKSADYVEFKRTVDELLQQRFSLGFYVARVQALVGQFVNDPERIDSLVRSAVLDQSPDKLQKYLAAKSTDPQVITKVLDVLKIAIGIASLWKHWALRSFLFRTCSLASAEQGTASPGRKDVTAVIASANGYKHPQLQAVLTVLITYGSDLICWFSVS
ncbi:MAG: hypothetical protein WCA19_26075 [Candidatus Acidiferrales bacterium]